jgi:hypothetical protein
MDTSLSNVRLSNADDGSPLESSYCEPILVFEVEAEAMKVVELLKLWKVSEHGI